MPSPPHTAEENDNSPDVENSQIHQYNNNINNRDVEENVEEKEDTENNNEDEDEDADADAEEEEEEEAEEDGEEEEEDGEEDEDGEDEDDVEGENMSQSSSGDEDECDNKEEFVLVKLSDIRKEVQCPICLGIIKKTRTVMECLHRFCRECIDKSMRLGNNECPACRTHCASRRSLRDDPNYDALIAAIYPDIDQYEEEELSYQEDEKARNMQIQAQIAQTFRRQTEALSKKRKRSQATYRRRRNYRSEDEEEANNVHEGAKYPSSQDERSTELKYKRQKRWRGHTSAAGASGGGGGDEHDQEVNKETMVTPVGWVGSSEMLAWGKGGLRSNTRHGSGATGNGSKHPPRNRLAKLGDHLRNLKENESEMEIQVVLISLDQQRPSALEHSFLSSRAALSVEQLCQYISLQTSVPPERVEILAAKAPLSTIQGQVSSSCALEACKDDFQVLDSQETLGGLRATVDFSQGHLTLAYRQKG